MHSNKEAPTKTTGITQWQKVLIASSCLMMVGGAGAHFYYGLRDGPVAIVSEPSAPLSPDIPSNETTPSLSELKGPPAGIAGKIAPAAPLSPSESAPVQPSEAPDPPTLISGEGWSPAAFRLGFSVFAGFSIGFAIKAFFKIAAFCAGLILIGSFGLHYAGLFEIDWSAVAERFDVIVDRVSGQLSSFQRFVTGHLPSSGAAAAGLGAGLKKN